MMFEAETWLPVREFPDEYEVSDFGRVRRSSPTRGSRVGKLRSPVLANYGYYTIMFHRSRTSEKPKLRAVHRLVADAFLGPIPEGMQVNHKNGVKTDNRVSNLEIVTNAENRAHSYRVLGIAPNRPTGENNANTKLTWRDIDAIRASSDNYTTLAKAYGVSRPTIARIVKKEVWRDDDRPATPES